MDDKFGRVPFNYVCNANFKWEQVRHEFVELIRAFVKVKPEVYLHVIGPFLRTKSPRCTEPYMLINEKLRIAFVKSFAVNMNFAFHQHVQITSNELQNDGVRLNELGKKKLHDMLEDCRRSGWITRLVDHGRTMSRQKTPKEGGKDATKVRIPISQGSDRKAWIPRKDGSNPVTSSTTQIQEKINLAEHWKKRFEEERRKDWKEGPEVEAEANVEKSMP
jgi:hypothetical protein